MFAYMKTILYLCIHKQQTLTTNIKTMAKVIFSVGVAHPLYNKVVEATITHTNCGYNGKQCYAVTNDEVYHAANPRGILIYNRGRLVGFEKREAFSEKWEGYVERIIEV